MKLINYATVVYFAFDMLLRCIADGVLLTPDAYLLVRVSVFTLSWLDGLCLRHAATVRCRERAADARRLALGAHSSLFQIWSHVTNGLQPRRAADARRLLAGAC